MTTPDAIGAEYATDVLSSFDFYKPQYLEELFSRYGDQGMSYFQLLRTMGFEKPVANDQYGHFEENRIHEVFHCKTTTANPGAGNDLVVILDDAQDTDASDRFYPRLYDSVLLKNNVPCYIAVVDVTTDPAVPRVTLRPYDATDNIGVVTAGDTLSIFSNAFSEGSGQPSGALRGTYKYQNYAQIIKETVSVTGTEMTQQPWFKRNTLGTNITAYWYLGQLDIDYRMQLRIDGAMLFNKITTNTNAVDATTNRAIKTTEGLYPYIRSKGNTYTKALGSYSVTDFDEIDRILDQESVGKKSLILAGIKRHQEFENILVEYFSDTNIQFAHKRMNSEIFNGDESIGATVNFKYLTKSERTFMFKRFNNLNNPKTYGAPGYTLNESAVFLPVNRKKDPESGKMVDSIGCRYKALGNYSRRMETYQVGGAGLGLKVTEFDTRNTFQRGHVGAHHKGANQFVLLESS